VVEPPVPEAVRRGEDWELVEEDTRKIADTALVEVTATRALYGDRTLREAVREATDVDRLWRSFFASRLTTRPPLSAGIGDLVVRTIARPRAHRQFVGDLESRGFRGVEKADEREVPLGGGTRGRGTRFTGRIPIEGADPVPVDAWLVLQQRDRGIVVAGGIYPVEPLGIDGAENCFGPPGEYRTALLELVQAV
jgi:hypothetical protein